MGGGTETLDNPVYTSLDGTTWTIPVRTAPWQKRTFAGGAVFPAASPQMLFFGGESGSTFFNDVWGSVNGLQWTQLSSAAAWGPRSRFGCIVFKGTLWLFGGRNGTSGFNDIYSSPDGVNWTKAAQLAAWSPRWDFATVIFNDQLWILGGDDGGYTNEVWRTSDGTNWTQIPAPPWGGRTVPVAESFGDYLYLFDGVNSSGPTGELWRLNIKIVNQKETFVWTTLPTPKAFDCAALASVKFFGGAWLAGGYRLNDGVRAPNRTVWVYAPK
jgi:hypothetical protein